MQIPSMKDVEEIRTNTLVTEIKEVIDNEKDLKKYSTIIERLVNEDYTSLEIASGLLKMVMGNEKEETPVIDENYGREKFGRGDREDRYGGRDKFSKSHKDDRYGGRDKGKKGSFRGTDEEMVRLFINVGKNQRVKPNDIVGAIAGETGIPGKSIGEIAIFDKYSFVEVPKKLSEKIVKIMDKNTIKGKTIAMQVANERQY